MSSYNPRIITASAGTGKTFRLSLEYVSLILRYYEHPEFSPDNILVLTFTKKATAEIRERIVKHLKVLISTSEADANDKRELITALKGRDVNGQEQTELDMREHNALFSVYKTISNNRQMLQVMTLDSYISSIFRNIVRPLRGIDAYELDTQAAAKRMPDILSHLMSPDMKHRADKLLRRKIAPSLDEYSRFFTSLIERRWYYYLFSKRLVETADSSLQDMIRKHDPEQTGKLRDEFTGKLNKILDLIDQVYANDKCPYGDFFNAGFKSIFSRTPEDRASLLAEIERMLPMPAKLYRLFDVMSKDTNANLYNGNKFRKTELAPLKTELITNQEEMLLSLANYLLITLLVPEQQDIMDIWGEVLKEYDRLVYRYRNLSYDDISWLTFEALYSESTGLRDPGKNQVDNEFYQFLSHRSRFILIDEFQDTSLIQFNILKPIIEEVTAGEGSKEFGGLVVVGDEKQSIFGWRGGERDLLLNLQEIIGPIKSVTTEVLDSSWRSSPMIMSFVNSCFGDDAIHAHLANNNMSWDYRDIISMKPELDKRGFIRFKIANYQSRGKGEVAIEDIYQGFITNMVKPVLAQKDHGSVAIICRKTKELSELQLMLESNGITGVFEPSQPVTEHPLVKPLIYWLKFLSYEDLYALMALLRSDYLRIKATPLKRAVQALRQYVKTGEADFSGDPILSWIWGLADEAKVLCISQACELLMNRMLDIGKISEREIVNLDAFLNVVRDYELSHADVGKNIPQFLKYLEDNLKSEQLRQRPSEQTGSLQLLTIHKSKGLQFDTVLVFYNLSSRPGNDYQNLTHYTKYATKDFSEIEDFAVTLHYGKLITKSGFSGLSDLENRREQLEEMNNLYVAFTRAVSGLGIYIAYQGSGRWEDYYTEKAEKKKKPSLPLMLTNACYDYMQYCAEPDGANQWGIYGEDASKPKQEERDIADQDNGANREELRKYDPILFRKYDWDSYIQYDQAEQSPLRRLGAERPANLTGDLVHYYLSYIVRNTPDEHVRALSEALRRFGSILSSDAIKASGELIRRELSGMPWLFSGDYDLIFNERDIWHEGRKLRIDRLMINNDQHKIMIVDYKTGRIHEPDQLDEYRRALCSLNWVQQMGFEIETRFVKIAQTNSFGED